MNPTDVIQPYLERFLLGEKKQWSELVLEASREMALSALSLPAELQRFMDRALRGELEVRVRNLDENVRVLYGVGQQLLWGMLGAVSAVLAVVFEGRGQADASFGAKLAAGAFGVFLFFTWLGGRPRKRRDR
jgi:ubiquinone biosynthesis protein